MATFTVSTSDQLKTALQSAHGGDKILLEAGDYGRLEMRGTQDPRFVYSSEVTIASADPDNPAVLKSMLLQSVKNVTIDGVKFDLVTTASTGLEVSSFKVDVSSDIKFKNTTFDGDVYKGSNAVEKGYGAGFGLQILRTDNVTVEDFELLNVPGSRPSFGRSRTSSSATTPSISVFRRQPQVLDDHHGADRGEPHQEHPGEPGQRLPPRHDPVLHERDGHPLRPIVVIRGNILNSGDSKAASQSIFMRNEAVDSQGAGRGMYYSNFLIEDNVIYNAHSNAIWVGYADGLVIRNNTLLQNTASAARSARQLSPMISSRIRRTWTSARTSRTRYRLRTFPA